jgi:PAS domain-containing protein
MSAIPQIEPPQPAETGGIWKRWADLASGLNNFRVAEKISAITALLILVMTLLVAMSIQTFRLQAQYRHALATSATAAINVGRVNALIYAIVMESRGIYMSTDPVTVKRYADELVKRNRELAGVVGEWEKAVDFSDDEQFPAFKQRILQFIDFRDELVRRATKINPAAGREWGDNDANRALRTQLNVDLEAFARVLDGRAMLVQELSDQTRMASWYLALLGLAGLLLAALNVLVIRHSVTKPLSDIAKATDLITAGKVNLIIPHVALRDEIGHLARAVRNFRDATGRNQQLEQLEIGTAKQRDEVMDQRDKLTDKYHTTKWQLSAALNSMPQGMIMLDSNAVVLTINDQYRKMYRLPPTIKAGSSLEEILQHRAENGMFTGDVKKYHAAIVERIIKRQPTCHEITLGDDRVICIQERGMDGGGWIAMHEDITEQRRGERILERTEQFLAAIIENVTEGIIAKDARSLRYVMVNRAAEKMIGMSRAEIMGKTARELFPAAVADLIERRDRQLLEQEQQFDPIVDTIDNPVRGPRTIAVRRLQVGGPDRESHLYVSMFEDRTVEANVSEVAA